MKYDIKIISLDEARRMVSVWPKDVSFGSKFSQLHNVRYGFQSGYVVAENPEHAIMFPIQWGDGTAHSVHKGHTMPLKIGTGEIQLEWNKIASDIRRLTESNIYIADFAISESMGQGLMPLPLAVFIVDTSVRDINTLFATFNKTTRNLIRRSQEQGFRVELVNGNMPDQYYELYVHHQKSMGTPPRAKEQFDDIARIFGDGFVLIGVYDNDRLVGMNSAWCADRGLWLSLNASLPEYAQRHVNYLLYYETMKWACEHAIDRVDLGGSSTRNGNIHNVFKLGFGASMTPLYRLVDGSLYARTLDTLSRKRRALRIRFNNLKSLWLPKN